MKKQILLLTFVTIIFACYAQNNNWVKMSVIKFQMMNSNTGNWEEIMFTNPGKYIEIGNRKDVLIEDLDILKFVGGENVIGFYKAMQFIDGTKNDTEKTELTIRYDGNFVLLDNNRLPSKSGKGAIFIYYGRNDKIGCIEIQSYLCMCKARIFVSDYQTGLKILNE